MVGFSAQHEKTLKRLSQRNTRQARILLFQHNNVSYHGTPWHVDHIVQPSNGSNGGFWSATRIKNVRNNSMISFDFTYYSYWDLRTYTQTFIHTRAWQSVCKRLNTVVGSVIFVPRERRLMKTRREEVFFWEPAYDMRPNFVRLMRKRSRKIRRESIRTTRNTTTLLLYVKIRSE